MTHTHCKTHGLIDLEKPLTEAQSECLENCTDQIDLDQCRCGNLVEEGQLIDGQCPECIEEGKAIAETEAALLRWR
jgi:hypothetical protein